MKIFCVGMNYALHNKELCSTLSDKEAPVIFTKPDSALLKNHKPFFVPDGLGRIDYEGELVVRICRLGKSVPVRFAHRYYDAYTVGVDFTARELQSKLRKEGLPWDMCKGFDGSAVIGSWIEKQELATESIHFRLDLNGLTVQNGCSQDMLHPVDDIIAYVSRYFTLKTGDLLFTGTPAGVGPVKENDRIEGYIGDTKVLDFCCR